jgi:ADP-ribose pyrophosphatase
MEILNTKQITKQKWLNLYKTHFCHKGIKRNWFFASRNKQKDIANKTDGVMIIPTMVAPNGEKVLVLLKEFRIPIKDYEISFPAGLINKGEDIKAAAARELFEETGLYISSVTLTSPRVYSSAGITDESIQYVFADVTGELSTQNNEQSENIEILVWNYDKIAAILCTGVEHTEKISAKTWAILHAVIMAGKI